MAPGKPESALAKAKDLIIVNKTNAAIEVLSECVKAQKKQKAWVKTNEEVMMLLANLCVDTRKSQQFKEIIHQYKNMTLQANPKSLEDVVKHYLSLAKDKTDEAREKSKQVVVDIDDLDNPDTPENLMLSAINNEDEQQRQDRTLLTPMLKFLWESYRQCMELLRNNSKLEHLYHDIAQETFEFCLKYDRKSEFRKLSEILRNHMLKFQNTTGLPNAMQTAQTPEKWSCHLDTRLKMLECALKFKLYNEAFKAVEDIWNLLNTSYVQSKPRILAIYYSKAAEVFFQSGTSYLFHAAALHKLFFYSRENKKNMSPTELEQLALQVIISTLAVPLPNNREAVDPLLESGELTNPVKQKTLSILLKLPNPPTRASLIKDIQNNHVCDLVKPEIANFFKLLESDYRPLAMAKEAIPILDWLSSHPGLHVYYSLIQDIVVSKTLIQIGKVYKTMKITEFEKLCPYVDKMRLQAIIINLIRNLELPIRLDHRSEVLRFDVYTDLGISQRNAMNIVSQEINGISTLAQQLSKFSIAIFEVAEFIGYVDIEKQHNREWVHQCYNRKFSEAHQILLNRKNLIEGRKEEIERFEEENQRKLSEQIRAQDEKRRQEETHRLKEELEHMQKKKIEEQLEIQQKKMIKAKITYLKSSDAGNKVLKNFTEKELEEMDEIKLVKMQCDEKTRLKEEEEEKLRKMEQKVDYFQRALRLEEIPHISHMQLERYEIAKKIFEDKEEKRRMDAQNLHLLKMKNKELCLTMKTDIEKYISSTNEESDLLYEQKFNDWNKECEEIKRSYYEKRMNELLEEKKVRDLILEKEKEERERIEKEQNMKSEKSTAYVPPHLRKREGSRMGISDKSTKPNISDVNEKLQSSSNRSTCDFDRKQINTDQGWRQVSNSKRN